MDDQIFGLGVADTKLDFLCKLEALKEFVKRPMHTPFVLVGTFGAQNGMAGAIKLVRKKMISARRALIGEPTDLQVMRAGQGLAVVEISIPFSEEEKNYRFQHDLLESSSTQSRIFMGKAAHSSRPHLGENAIVKMLEYLTQLPEGIAVMDLDGGLNYNSVPSSAVLEVDLVGGLRNPIVPKIFEILERAREVESDFSKYPYDLTEPVLPTMNIGMIRTFEDQVRVTGSCRLPPSVPDPVYEKWMSLLNEACVEQGATFRVRDYKKSFATESDSPFLKSVLQIAEKMALNAAPGRIESASEASIFSRLGVECLVFGPGQSVGNSHAPNESIKIEDLKKATEFYKLAAERFCL